MKEIGEATATVGLIGDKLYQVRARAALPLLVRQAKAEQPTIYSDLAEELAMPNPRNLDYPLGTIGNALRELSALWNCEVPPIQALVINKKTQLPGEGIAWFAPDAHNFRAASTKQKREIINTMLSKVYSFDQWDSVLHHFGLQPVDNTSLSLRPRQPIHDTAHGESSDHRTLKDFIAHNPHILGVPRSCVPGQTEFIFGSADAVDVLFRNGDEWVGVEVKSARSGYEDIARGLFQCIKYRALLEATQMVEQRPINCRAILVLEAGLPRELIALRNTLGVDVLTNISPR